jgi:hypothetical protein
LHLHEDLVDYHENPVTRKAYHEACRAKTQANLERWERERRGAMTPEDLAAEEQRRREIEEKVRRTDMTR